jgi:predicted RNA-binding protein
MQKFWINVISKNHVQRGIQDGITQSGHGKEAPLRKMHQGDMILFYSPKQSLEGDEKLQAFTALAKVANEEIYQFEMSPTFRPYRRKVVYEKVNEVSIKPLIDKLDFIQDKTHWGYMFRFGLFEISKKDFEIIVKAMQSK